MLDNTQGGPVRRAWVAPLVATVLTVPGSLLAYAFAGLTPMACDACDGAVADRFTRGFDSAYTVLRIGLAAAFVLLLVSWCLPWSERNVVPRRVLAAFAPGTVLVSVLLFASMVPWPS
ncbi:hypothetical protein ABT173_06160 [Streptomyces sp. NPDC001795]|uniref:hypothetical protein n=1 Tax=unclassified Streptomyces TaxID=2593676 RepID=UPI0033242A0F